MYWGTLGIISAMRAPLDNPLVELLIAPAHIHESHGITPGVLFERLLEQVGQRLIDRVINLSRNARLIVSEPRLGEGHRRRPQGVV